MLPILLAASSQLSASTVSVTLEPIQPIRDEILTVDVVFPSSCFKTANGSVRRSFTYQAPIIQVDLIEGCDCLPSPPVSTRASVEIDLDRGPGEHKLEIRRVAQASTCGPAPVPPVTIFEDQVIIASRTGVFGVSFDPPVPRAGKHFEMLVDRRCPQNLLEAGSLLPRRGFADNTVLIEEFFPSNPSTACIINDPDGDGIVQERVAMPGLEAGVHVILFADAPVPPAFEAHDSDWAVPLTVGPGFGRAHDSAAATAPAMASGKTQRP